MQAYAAGFILRGHGIERVVSSDAVRATQTAKAIATVLGVETGIDSRLRERDWAEPPTLRRPGSLEDPSPRITAVLHEIIATGLVTAVVTHGDIVCTLLDLLEPTRRHRDGFDTGSDVPNGSALRMSMRGLRHSTDRPL